MYVFDFRNFVPDEGLENHANGVLRQLMESAPYDSSCTAYVEQAQDGQFIAQIELRSSYGPFRAMVKTGDGRHALDRVQSLMERQVQEWHKRRFAESAA